MTVSEICGKFLVDYWRNSYDNRQNYRQVEKTAFPEKEREDEDENPDTECEVTETEDLNYQALLDENADCIGWLKIPDTDISYPVVQGKNCVRTV